MSWSEFVWDANIPGLPQVTLTTTTLAFDKESFPKQAGLTCNTQIYCGSGDCCIPKYNDLCNSAAPQLFLFADGMYGISTQNHPATCCCSTGPCTCDGYSYTCGIKNLAQVCGVFNDILTCSLGKNGAAHATGLKQGTDWAITINADYASPGGNWSLIGQQHTGWVHAVYSFNFQDYNVNNVPTGPLPLSAWLVDICTKTSSAAPQGMDPLASTRIRDSHIVYGLVFDTYNQLYNDGYYQQHPNSRQTFQRYDFFSFGFQTFFNTIISGLAGNLLSLFPTGLFPDAFATAMTTVLQPPIPVQLPDNIYEVSLSLSYVQYQNYLAASDKDSFINALLAGLLRDNEGQMGNLARETSWSPDNPVLSQTRVDSVTAIQLWDTSSQPSYLVTTGIAADDWKKNWATTYKNYFFATAQITGTVTKWSPLLAVYFQAFGNASFDQKTCLAIAHPPNSSNPGTLPVSCYQVDCLDQGTCITDIKTYCPFTYTPPSYSTRTTTEKYLVSNNFADCYCYTSALAPISDPTPGNVGAMCFDKFCSPQLRQEFDLNDAKCKTTCDTVYKWMTATGADQSRNASHMDWQRFEEICGKHFQPYKSATLNTGILVSGLVATLLALIVIFALAKHKNLPTQKMWSRIILAALILLGGTGFLARDFAGISNCNTSGNSSYQFECTSRITKKHIPKQFCNYVLNCECLRDEDCPTGCLCASTSCQPQSGTRGFQTINTKNRPMQIISIVLAILFIIALNMLYREEHWKINKTWFMAGVIGIAAIPVLYYGLKTLPEQQFTEACQKGGVCATDEDCRDGTRCIAGQCEALTPGCPVPQPQDPPANILPTGTYIIQAKPWNQYLAPQVGLPLRMKNTQVAAWSWDADKNTLTANMPATNVTVTPLAYDICAAKGCQGTVYGQDISRLTPVPKFILGQDGSIYSIEAKSNLVPDTTNPCQETPCPAGNCGYVTYGSGNPWIFTPCDPKTTCLTSCGVCLPYTNCEAGVCQPILYNFYFYQDPAFKTTPVQQLGMWNNVGAWAPIVPPQPNLQPWFFDPVSGRLGSPRSFDLDYQKDSGFVIGVPPGQSSSRWRIGSDNVIYLDTKDNWFIGQDTGSFNVKMSFVSPTVAPRYLQAVPQ